MLIEIKEVNESTSVVVLTRMLICVEWGLHQGSDVCSTGACEGTENSFVHTDRSIIDFSCELKIRIFDIGITRVVWMHLVTTLQN